MSSIKPKLGEDRFSLEDIIDMVDSTCQLDEILLPSLFGKTPFLFRVLQRTLELHLVDSVQGSKYAINRATDAEGRNQGLKQLIWFLFVAGATAEEVSDSLELYCQSRQSVFLPGRKLKPYTTK